MPHLSRFNFHRNHLVLEKFPVTILKIMIMIIMMVNIIIMMMLRMMLMMMTLPSLWINERRVQLIRTVGQELFNKQSCSTCL